MNKAYNIHIFCVDRETVTKYMGSITRCIEDLKEETQQYIEDDNFFCANKCMKELITLDELRGKIHTSMNEIEQYGLFLEKDGEDNGENESEATDNELL